VVSDHREARHGAGIAKSGDGPIDLRTNRPELFLHIHDGGRRRREKSCNKEVPGRVCASFKGKLHALACRADVELQGHADPISNPVRQLGWYCLDSLFEYDECGGRGVKEDG